MNRCVISYATRGRENYPQGLRNLIPSLRLHDYAGDFYVISPDATFNQVDGIPIVKEHPLDFMPHDVIPYGFKAQMFQIAREQGYDQVLWCDAAIVALGSLEPVWAKAEYHGLCVGQNSGCPQSWWTSDEALDRMGCPRDAMFEQVMGFALAIDFRHGIAGVIQDEWLALAKDGVTFNGSAAGRVKEGAGSDRPNFRAHRHDQSALSWLVHKYAVPVQPYGLIGYRSDAHKFQQMVLANQGIQ